MSKKRISLGKHGEKLAADFLRKQGYSIVAQNYRQKTGEIDIIAHDADCLVFVEVKTRSNLQYGHPYEAVTARKQLQLSKVALDYLTRNNLLEESSRFDVVSILLDDNDRATIEHLQNCIEIRTAL